MRMMSDRTGLIVAHMALAILALMVVAVAPPAWGKMLLAPVNGEPVDRGPAVAAAAPLSAGPLSGPMIVEDDRRSLAMGWGRPALIVAAAASFCRNSRAGDLER